MSAFSDIYIFGHVFNFCCLLLKLMINLHNMRDFSLFADFILVFVILWCNEITDGALVCSNKINVAFGGICVLGHIFNVDDF